MGEIIDLTNELDNTIIDLDADDSTDRPQETIVLNDTLAPSDEIAETIKETASSTSQEESEGLSKQKTLNFGKCPICWDPLGLNFLASTKCGHVFCLLCLERALHNKKQCPTCRCPIERYIDYHPLYLNIT